MTEVEVTQSKTDLAQKLPQLHRMISQLAITTELEKSFDMDSFMERILAGESEEEVFEAQNLASVATKDWTDKPFFLRADDVQWMKSTLEDGAFPFYAILNVRDMETNEMVSLNGGGLSFVTVLWKLIDMGAFDKFEDDGKPLVLKKKATSRGYEVVLLMPYALPKSAKK